MAAALAATSAQLAAAQPCCSSRSQQRHAARPALQGARLAGAFRSGGTGTALLARPRPGAPRAAAPAAITAAATAEVGKLISRVEIPAFIPRSDLMDQLLRWAIIEIQENGPAAVACPCKASQPPGGCGARRAAPAAGCSTHPPVGHPPPHPPSNARPPLPAGHQLHARGQPVGLHRQLPARRRERRRCARQLRL